MGGTLLVADALCLRLPLVFLDSFVMGCGWELYTVLVLLPTNRIKLVYDERSP
ncbi:MULTISPECIES: hypothetical protein [Trichocoleus]|uniref:Uncharacterized protein n=1 Tax=Trichocoleus desertorum GB2-A4 TaxID=2933944 RepID=A0ABV0JAP0_9CYAN|nr:hypothetical protein [Trichocoleus sp. FACHB-46]